MNYENYHYTDMALREVILTRESFVASQLISMMETDRLRFSMYQDYAKLGMVMHLEAIIYGREMAQIKIEWPADWWQHFKQRWFSKRMLTRWPVKMETKIVTASEYYPEVSAKNLPHFVKIQETYAPIECNHSHSP